jgi:hypothetical protein
VNMERLQAANALGTMKNVNLESALSLHLARAKQRKTNHHSRCKTLYHKTSNHKSCHPCLTIECTT